VGKDWVGKREMLGEGGVDVNEN